MSVATRSSAEETTVEKVAMAPSPRAHLMPPEVAIGERAARTKRLLVVALVAVLLLVGLSAAGALLLAGNAQSALLAQQNRTTELLAEQAQYIEVRQIADQLRIGETAKQVAVSPEIDWKAQMDLIEASLPAGTVISSATLASGTPTEPFAKPSDPLQGPRVAELVFTATTTALPDVSQWIDNLSQMPGFQDASPQVITAIEEGGFEVTIVMHVNADALTGRFAETEEVDE